MFIELAEGALQIAQAAIEDVPTILFVMLEHLPMTTVTSMLATLLIVPFFVTPSVAFP